MKRNLKIFIMSNENNSKYIYILNSFFIALRLEIQTPNPIMSNLSLSRLCDKKLATQPYGFGFSLPIYHIAQVSAAIVTS